MLKKLAATTALGLVLSSAAWADYEAGMTAYENENYFTAFQEFETSANDGDTASQFMLGALFADGLGARQNLVQAHKWFNIAASWGHDRAAQARRNIEGYMTAAQIDQAEALAAEWEPDEGDETVAGATFSVQNTQLFLNRLGYNAGVADGVMGPTTRSAIRAYQYDNDLVATGDLTRGLFDRLKADLETGDEVSVELVSNVQSELRRRGYDVPVVSGTVDTKTQAAIRAFQIDSGITANGEVSEGLLARLRSAQGTDNAEDQRARVRIAQTELNDLGYNAGPEDGVFGPTTRNAVRDYQSDNGLPVTGEVTDSLITHLRDHGVDTVAEQEQRDMVLAIEDELSTRGYYVGSIDGVVDNDTRAAIRTYQSDAGMTIDGQADADLLASLEADDSDDDMSDYRLVRNIQVELNDKDYNAGAADGVFGPSTRRAIVTYQSDAGLEITGEASERLLRHLRNSDVDAETVAEVSTTEGLHEGELIQQIEDELIRLGWDVGTPDGNWGEASINAAKEYQVAIGVEVDGEPDQELLNQLKSSYRQGNANDLVMGLAAQFLRALGGNDD